MRPFYTPHQLRHDQDDILFINEHWDEIKEAYFQVLEALKAPSVEVPETPTPESGCECTWIKKTFIPTYFYITRDSSVADIPEEEIQNFFNNISVACSFADYKDRFSHLVKLDVEGDVYALPVPHVTGSNTRILYVYNFIGSTNSDAYESTNPPFYKNVHLSIYANTGVMYGNKISLTLYKDLDKGYLYLTHDNTETDPTPMTFKCLETIKPCAVEEKPEDTPENTPDTPEGTLASYTVKVRFTPSYWYDGDAKFGAYCVDTQTWKEATKVEDDVVYYTFTEEEAIDDSAWIFTRHKSDEELSWYTKFNQTKDVGITFDDTVMNDVITIDENDTTRITVGSAYI